MPKELKSEIPGNVWKIEIADGDQVNEGDVILILESMKMEIPVESPCAGRCRIMVREGEAVQEGALIAVIE